MGHVCGLIVLGRPTKVVRRKGWQPQSSSHRASRQSGGGPTSPPTGGGIGAAIGHVVLVAVGRTPLPPVTATSISTGRLLQQQQQYPTPTAGPSFPSKGVKTLRPNSNDDIATLRTTSP
jgi:hypothetical protein